MTSAHDIWYQSAGGLDPIFRPRSVAVIGASEAEGSVGRTLVTNLVSSPFGGTIYPVNPKRTNILGIRAYPHVGAIPEKVDLAVIAVPAPFVPGVVGECVRAGAGGAIIISAGFKELGAEGEKLEAEVMRQAGSRLRIIGPNCLGVMNPVTGLNATFANGMARKGNIAFVSQSGALMTSILDWSRRAQVGFSAFVSVGSMLDVGWGDLIDYLAVDGATQSILIYMESIGDARAFLSSARETALTKPIIVLKAGRSEAAAKAASSHTGALAGSDAVLDAAFRRSGVLRVNRISDLFEMAGLLSKQPRPRGPRLAIVTNAGGPGVLATDAIVEAGGEPAVLSEDTKRKLDAILPSHWSHGNPIDVLGDAGPERFAKTLEAAARGPESDGLLVILTPQAMTDPTRTALEIAPYARIEGKPVLASWMGGRDVEEGKRILTEAGVPVYDYPDDACRLFEYMWRHSLHLKGLYETPMRLAGETERTALARERSREIIQPAVRAGRTVLTESESKEILSLYGIPVVATHTARSEDEAVRRAGESGYPAVLKLLSETITHKTDVGGVKLNLKSPDEVRAAFRSIRDSVTAAAGPGAFAGVTVQPMVTRRGTELILGSSFDPQFGPVILFGAGGELAEVMKDYSLALPPLNTTLAQRLVERTRISRALRGVRGRRPVPAEALLGTIVRFTQLVTEEPLIREIDVNPLLASDEGVIALDARVILHAPGTDLSLAERPAIRPYPSQYAFAWKTSSGEDVAARPIRPEDEPLVVEFHRTLSEQSVYQRYFRQVNLDERIAHDRLVRVCFNDYNREIALVVEIHKPRASNPQIVAIGRLIKLRQKSEAEFSMLVSDAFQRRGIGTELLKRLIEVGRVEKIGAISASILAENRGMRRVCEKLGFRIESDPVSGGLSATLDLV